MWDQEKKHLAVMNKIQLQHHVRPTVLWEVAQVAGYGLGVVTALIGKEAAMACTEAVETVIGEHYQEYVSYEILIVRSPNYPSAVNSNLLRICPIIRVCLC
jgi:3-demethoxyubiquinol 3-hydroxylase